MKLRRIIYLILSPSQNSSVKIKKRRSREVFMCYAVIDSSDDVSILWMLQHPNHAARRVCNQSVRTVCNQCEALYVINP